MRTKQTTRRLIIGKSGSGKTTLARLHSWAERTVIVNPHRLDFQCPNVASAREAGRRLRAPAFRFALVPEESRPQAFDQTLAWCAECVYSIGDCLFVCDEMDGWWGPMEKHSPLEKLVVWGRNRGIDFIGTTRRPAEINRAATSQATQFDIFRTDEPRDLDWIRAYCGGAISTAVLALPARFRYVHYDLITRQHFVGSL